MAGKILEAAAKFLNIDPVAILDKGVAIAEQFIESPADKAAFQLKMMELKQKEQSEALQAKMEAERAAYADTASARTMYAADNGIQKILALLFTLAFFGFMVFLLFLLKDANLTSDQVNLIYAMFGAVSGIMVTIVGFYFGSSAGSRGKDDIIKALQAPPPAKE